MALWTSELDAAAKNMLAEGASLNEVANALGTTKNAVVGRMWRHKWPRAPVAVPSAVIPKKLKHRRPRPRIERSARAAVTIAVIATPATRTILDVGAQECRFPLGDRWPWPLCGAAVHDMAPYCAGHCTVCYGRS
jgi:hypothetical protein